MRNQKVINTLILILFSVSAFAQNIQKVDICIYGGSSAGIIAAYTAKKMGKSVLVVEPGKYIGGLTTGGLGATDIGNKYAITGLSREFYRKLGTHYGKFEQWTFEPHVATKIFDDMVKEADLQIVRNHRLIGLQKKDGKITEITVEVSDKPNRKTNKRVQAKVFLDCSYEGDLMAKAGVSYAIGREPNAQYGETHNGVQVSEYHQFPDGIDPYIVPGRPESGLVYGIQNQKLNKTGSGDQLIQAYNFRLCLTQDKNNQIPFTLPKNYDPARYTLLARVIEKEKWKTIKSSFTRFVNGDSVSVINEGGFLITHMPNGKTDVNNFGGFSTDVVGENYNYPEGDYATRKKIWQKHEDYTKGLLYFLSHDESIPLNVRKEMQTWGYTKDEFKDQNGFSNQLYVREARRMVGELVMTQKHCEGDERVTDGVGMAAYGMDSHTCQRIVINGMVKNEGDVQIPVAGPFPISYRAITPKKTECKNLLVPLCLSASHIAFGSIRMEPVFMVMGQSAATAAVMAIDAGVSVQDINVKKLQQKLKQDPLLNQKPLEVLVDNDDKSQVTIQGNWVIAQGGDFITTKGGYGKDFLIGNDSAPKAVKYNPNLTFTGKYAIYTYIPAVGEPMSQLSFNVFDGRKVDVVVIDRTKVTELGENTGEWVKIGDYPLPAGKQAYVEVVDKGNKGKVVADAMIFKPY